MVLVSAMRRVKYNFALSKLKDSQRSRVHIHSLVMHHIPSPSIHLPACKASVEFFRGSYRKTPATPIDFVSNHFRDLIRAPLQGKTPWVASQEAEKSINIKNSGRNPPPRPLPQGTPDPANSLCWGLFSLQNTGNRLTQRISRGGGAWGAQNSLCWISSLRFQRSYF